MKLGDLKPRQWRYLTEDEVTELKGEKQKPQGIRRNSTNGPKRVPSGKRNMDVKFKSRATKR